MTIGPKNYGFAARTILRERQAADRRALQGEEPLVFAAVAAVLLGCMLVAITAASRGI